MTGAEWNFLRWIPLLPLVAVLLHGVSLGWFRRRIPPVVTVVLSCGAVFLAFAFSFVGLLELTALPEKVPALTDGLFTWFGAGGFSAEVAFALDPLAAVMVLLVNGVSLLVHVASAWTMERDPHEDTGFQRFFAWLGLATFSMSTLVLADNLLLMFLGWQGVALASHFLSDFWYATDSAERGGRSAFVFGRIGDVGFLAGMLLLLWALADLGIPGGGWIELRDAYPAIAEQTIALPGGWQALGGASEWRVGPLLAACFFFAAAGKSAQFPFHGSWVASASGPASAAALTHTAITALAGVYLLCRLAFVLESAPTVSGVIAWLGFVTAFGAACAALVQTDLQRGLAWSTVCQLGLVFIALGCGSPSAALFHGVTHAFAKAALFLGAGAVLGAVHPERRVDRMGGLGPSLPITQVAFFAGAAALAGLPFTAGFFSLEGVLLAAFQADAPGSPFLFAGVLGVVALASFQIFRLAFLVFAGDRPVRATMVEEPSDPGKRLWMPLLLLAFLAIFGGWLGPSAALNPFPVEAANSNSFANFLAPSLPVPEPVEPPSVDEDAPLGIEAPSANSAASMERALASLVALLSVGGLLAADFLHRRRPRVAARMQRSVPALHRFAAQGFHFDRLVHRFVLSPAAWFCDRVLDRTVDRVVIDRLLIAGPGAALRAIARDMLRYTQSGFPQGAVLGIGFGALVLAAYLVIAGAGR